MLIQNNPFALNLNVPYDRDDRNGNYISLEDAKKMFPRVGFQEFYARIQNTLIPAYLYDCYYMHYLCIMGDTIRMRNFIVYLRENNKDPVKVCNYNLLPEFDYGTCLHTTALWNSQSNMFALLLEECEGDLRMPDGNGFSPSETQNIPMSMYKNPFVAILGHGERVFDHMNIWRRQQPDFEVMIAYLDNINRELDAQDEEGMEEEEEEEEEEEIEVILDHENFNDFAHNMNNMHIEQNVGRDVFARLNGVDYDIPRENENMRDVRRRLF